MPPAPLPERPRAALIGVSGYGRIHYNLLRDLRLRGEVALTAVVIIDPRQQMPVVAELKAAGCDIFDDYRAMLERHRGRLELCFIPTGIPWHAPMTLAALEAGAHVLVEKPLAASVAEVLAIRAAEERCGRVVNVGFQYHCVPETLGLKRALLAGAIGRLRRIRVLGMWPREAGYYSRTDWAGRVRLGQTPVLDSPVSNAFGHHLNLALFLAGAKADRSAAPARIAAELYRAQPIENFDTTALRIETDTGVPIHFYASHSCRHAFEPELVLDGEHGRAVWKHSREFRIEPEGAPPETVQLGSEQSAREVMFRNVLRRLSDPSVLICTTAIALEHTRCIEAVQATGPIRDIPPGWIETDGDPGPRGQTWVRGLEETMRRAFEQGCTLGETGCPWASPPLAVDVVPV